MNSQILRSLPAVTRNLQSTVNPPAREANTMLRLTARNFKYKSPEVMLALYNSLWGLTQSTLFILSPSYRKDTELLEREQRPATKITPWLRAQPYEDRVKRLNLSWLENKQLSGDLHLVFKYINKLNNFDDFNLFELQTDSKTRNNCFPLKWRRCGTCIGKHFFPNWVIHHWSRLPAEAVSVQPMNSFKARIDCYFVASGIN